MKKQLMKILNSASILILVAAMLVSFAVFFGAPVLAWDGTAATAFSSGSGTESSPYVIKTDKQFGYLINQLNNGVTYEGLYIRLDANLDMTGSPWTYNTSASFAGTLDGQCYTITTDSRLLPNIAATGTVKKLNVMGDQMTTDSVLCDWNHGQIFACSVRGTIPNEPNEASLFCSYNYGTIYYCGAVGSVIASAGGDYDSYSAGIAARNHGTIDSCFAAVSASASASGRYDYAYEHPLGNNKETNASVTNSYYDKTLYTDSTTMGMPLTTAEMQSDSFLQMISGFTVPGVEWVAGDDGYPVLKSCGLGVANFTGWESQGKATYHTSSLTVTIKRSGVTSGTIYYTTDGTDPKTSSTRKGVTTASTTVTLTGDRTLAAVVYYNNLYGTVTKTEFVYMPGAGTQASPYQILTKKGLDAVRLDTESCYKLMTDLTYTEADYAMGGVASGGWNPISTFSGTFDGAGHAITGLRGNSGGLFDNNTGIITSLRMVDHKLFCGGESGPIVNTNGSGGTVTRCYAKSAYTTSSLPSAVKKDFYSYSGGIAGYNYGTISYCSTEGVVAARQVTREGKQFAGGIAGAGGTIENCTSMAYLIADDTGSETVNYIFMGGISGAYSDAYDCWADTDMYVNARINYDAYVGSIVGHFSSSYAIRCVAPTASVVESSNAYIRLYNQGYAPGYNYCYHPTDGRLPADFAELDFTSEWMITNSGIRPQGVMDADGHCYSLSRYTQDSCDVTGTAVLRCNLCDSSQTHTIDGPGHVEVTDKAVETTCTAPGLTEGSHCSRCSKVLVAQEKVEQLPHDYVNGICAVCKAERKILDSGTCGTNLTWKLYDDYTLVIRGTGKMDDYNFGGSNAPWFTYRFNQIKKIAIEEGVTSVGDYAFHDCEKATVLELPKTVTSIGEGAFENCYILTGELDLSNVTSMEKCAFQLSNFSKITLGKSLTTIPRACFAGIYNLTEIEIPANVTTVGAYAFDYCPALTKVTFSGAAPVIEEKAFDQVVATVNYPAGYGSWNSVAGQDYGGTLTWVGYDVEDSNVSISTNVVGGNDFGAVITAPTGGWKTGENTFTVSCDEVCIVAVSYDGGKSYTRLKATETDGGYQFSASNVDSSTTVVVTLAGDTNGDGQLSTADATRLQAAILNKIDLDALSLLAADANGDGKTSTADITKMRAVILKKTELKW